MFRVIEGGRPPAEPDDDLSGDEFRETLIAMSAPQRRAVLARLHVMWPMHRRVPAEHAFLLSLAKWIENHADRG